MFDANIYIARRYPEESIARRGGWLGGCFLKTCRRFKNVWNIRAIVAQLHQFLPYQIPSSIRFKIFTPSTFFSFTRADERSLEDHTCSYRSRVTKKDIFLLEFLNRNTFFIFFFLFQPSFSNNLYTKMILEYRFRGGKIVWRDPYSPAVARIFPAGGNIDIYSWKKDKIRCTRGQTLEISMSCSLKFRLSLNIERVHCVESAR